jgi:Zn-dependent protease
MDQSQDLLRQLLLFIPPFILSLCIHEYAHAWTANRLGDSTARYLGRLTLDPLAHMSVFGTLVFPILSIVSGSKIFFGWANPVPVDSRNFRHPRRDMALVAAAGPASNVLISVFCACLLAILARNPGIQDGFSSWISNPEGVITATREMLVITITLNLFLAFFNLLPIPPLDGSRILQAFVPHEVAEKIDSYAVHAQMLLIMLALVGGFKFLALPVYIVLGLMMNIIHA